MLISEVYESLVDAGVIVPQEEVPPPTVPMDYSWARVSGSVAMKRCMLLSKRNNSFLVPRAAALYSRHGRFIAFVLMACLIAVVRYRRRGCGMRSVDIHTHWRLSIFCVSSEKARVFLSVNFF